MKPIKNVIFDFGGVIMDWNPRHLYRSYFKTEEEMEYFFANVCTSEWNLQQDAGYPMADATRERVAMFPEYREAIEMFYSCWDRMLQGVIPGSAELVQEVKDAGYGVYGLTNWSNETFPIAYERYPVFSLFEGIVVSGAERINKPDARLYRILLDRYGLDPEECVFLDDNQANVDAAIALGIRALRFISVDDVRPKLKALGVLA